jgi:hypothetical protein
VGLSIGALRRRSSPAELREARARFDAKLAAERATFPHPLPRDPGEALAWLEQLRGQVTWAPAEVVWDDPSLMAKPLAEQSRHEIVVENAYFIPDKKLTELKKLRGRGVEIRLLTSSARDRSRAPLVVAGAAGAARGGGGVRSPRGAIASTSRRAIRRGSGVGSSSRSRSCCRSAICCDVRARGRGVTRVSSGPSLIAPRRPIPRVSSWNGGARLSSSSR